MYKKIFTLFAVILFIFYSLEILLYQFIPNEQKTLTNIKAKRIELAKKMNLNYDVRSGVSAYFSEKNITENLYTNFYFNKSNFNLNTVKESLKRNELIPFRGPINKKTLSCAEDLNFKIINNDKFGFKNPNRIYDKKIEIALIGDSYAEGLCENENNDVAGHLRKKNFNTLNLGVTGSGPLLSLATLREYGSNFFPNKVIYLYFEGNDLIDLNWEKKTFLMNYLDTSFKLDYIKSTKDIKEFLQIAHNEKISLMKDIYLNESNTKTTEKNLFGTIKDILELTNLKNIFRSNFFLDQKKIEMDLFYRILKEMKIETNRFGGEFLFVYIPSWSRYFTKYNKDKILFDKKNEILNFLKKERINYHDFENEISKSIDKKEYFPLGYMGHFNSFGYKRLSESIINLINK